VRDHFTTMIDAYRDAGYASFAPVTIDTHQLGEIRPSQPSGGRPWIPPGTLPAIRRRPTTCSPPRTGGGSSLTPTTSNGTDLLRSSVRGPR
jgi:hypothetical protein